MKFPRYFIFRVGKRGVFSAHFWRPIAKRFGLGDKNFARYIEKMRYKAGKVTYYRIFLFFFKKIR